MEIRQILREFPSKTRFRSGICSLIRTAATGSADIVIDTYFTHIAVSQLTHNN